MIRKRYVYRVYRDGVFMGVLPYVTNDYQIDRQINTGGGQITIDLGQSLSEASDDRGTGTLVTDTGDYITTDTGYHIMVVSDALSDTMLNEISNRVEVWLYDDNYPTGRCKFSGVITEWQHNEADGRISITALATGQDLTNYIIEVYDSTPQIDNSGTIFTVGSAAFVSYYHKFAQTVTPSGAVTFDNIKLAINNHDTVDGVSGTYQVSIYQGSESAPTTLIASKTKTFSTNSAATDSSSSTLSTQTIQFDTSYTLLSGTQYTIFVENLSTSNTTAIIRTKSGFALGAMYGYNGSAYASMSNDMYFVLGAFNTIGRTYSGIYAIDEELKALIDEYNTAGGQVIYTATSIDVPTYGVEFHYTFKYNTVYEGIQKWLELSPSDWFWYVDLGYNILNYHQRNTVADHTFVKGKHVVNLELKKTMEHIINKVYFSGGDTGGGVNLLVTSEDADSIEEYGQQISLESDNRVTNTATAQTIADNIVALNKDPRYSTVVTILAEDYDIETINLGDMVGFDGYDAVTNALLLQIVGITETPDYVTLQLDTVQKKQADELAALRRALTLQETENNPPQ